MTLAGNYDAVLIVSFGGPEGMDDVISFLENVLRGRNVPRERMLEVAHHYALFGGVSPINAQNRALISALEQELKTYGPDLPIYWGNRNWHPLLADTLRQMSRDGVKHALAFFTSAYSSYSGCRQYREDILRAQVEVGLSAPQVSILRKFYNHSGFINPNIENIRAALNEIPSERRTDATIAFTAHSIPETMARTSRYETQLREACQLVSQGLKYPDWQLVYQSRSGSPSQPWLGPDVKDHLKELKIKGITDVVVAPIGFISDHMEVLYDLDVEARQYAEEIGLHMVRAATVGTHPAFISMIRALIAERITNDSYEQIVESDGSVEEFCTVECCLPGQGRPVANPAAIPHETK